MSLIASLFISLQRNRYYIECIRRKFKAEKKLVIAQKDSKIARIIAEKDCGIAERDLEIASLKVELAALKAQQQAPPPGEEAMADAA